MFLVLSTTIVIVSSVVLDRLSSRPRFVLLHDKQTATFGSLMLFGDSTIPRYNTVLMIKNLDVLTRNQGPLPE